MRGLARSWALGVDERIGCGDLNWDMGLTAGDAEEGDIGGE